MLGKSKNIKIIVVSEEKLDEVLKKFEKIEEKLDKIISYYT